MGNLLKTGPGQDPPEAPETAPRPTRAIFSHKLAEQARNPGLKDAAIIEQFGTAAELHELAENIRDRRAKLPPYRYVKCNNPACGRKVRVPYDSPVNGTTGCLVCNFGGFREIGFMIEMSAKEAAQYDKDYDDAFRKWAEQMEKATLHLTNEKLKANGQEPITLEQLRAGREREWAEQCERTRMIAEKRKARQAEVET